MVSLQSSIVHIWRKSHFIPCEIKLYDGILEFGKTHFSLERVCKFAASTVQRQRERYRKKRRYGERGHGMVIFFSH